VCSTPAPRPDPIYPLKRDASPIFRAQGCRLRLSNEGLNNACDKTAGMGIVNMNTLTSKPLKNVQGVREVLVSRDS